MPHDSCARAGSSGYGDGVVLDLTHKAAGDEIRFDFPYFAPTRVMLLPPSPVGGLLAGAGILDVRPRPPS